MAEVKDTYSLEEVEEIISKVRYKSLKALREEIEDYRKMGEESAFKALLMPEDNSEIEKAATYAHCYKLLVGIDNQTRNIEAPLGIKNYLED